MSKNYSIEKDNPYYREIVCLEIIGEHIDESDKCFLCYEKKVWEEVDDGEIEHMGFEPIYSLDEPIPNKNISTLTVSSSEIESIEENDKYVWVAK